MAYGAEEGYSRPRFRGTDDILSLMASATSQTVDTINRTGENLAHSYGQMPKLLGEGVKGFADSYRNAEERVRDKALEDEDRKLRKQEHDLTMKQGEQATKRGDIELSRLNSEEAWYNTPYGPAGGVGPNLPGKGMTRRDVERENKAKLSNLGVSEAEEGIKTTQATRANDAKRLELENKRLSIEAAGHAQQNKLLQEQLRNIKDQRAGGQVGAALSMDANQSQLPPGQAGPPAPPRTSQMDTVVQNLKAQGYNDIDIQTITSQQRAAQATAAREKSFIDRTVDPAGAAVQTQLTTINQKLPELRNLVGAVQRYKQIPSFDDTSPDAQMALQQVQSGLKGASFDPTTGQNLANNVNGGYGFSFTRGVTGGDFVQSSHEQAKQATLNVIQNFEAQANALASQGQIRNDPSLIQQAQVMKAELATYKQQLEGGANPQTHNTWQPGGVGGPTTQNPFQNGQAPKVSPAFFGGNR